MPISTETSGQSPLRHFKGRCLTQEDPDNLGVKLEERTGNDGSTYEVVVFKFVDLEVVKTVTPYPFPTAELVISHSVKAETRWAAMGDSIKRLLGPEEGADAENLAGKMQEWKMLPSPRRRPVDPNNPRGAWETVQEDCWQVVAVEGAEEAAEDLTEHLLDLADGKTEVQFHAVALADSRVQADTPTITAITERTLLPALIKAEKLTRDAEGVLHKAGG